MARMRVLIIDDHPMIRRGLRDMLDDDPVVEVCGEAADTAEALEQVRKLRPDLAIIDVSLPSGSGVELAKQIRALNRGIRMLFLSMHDDAVFAERALRAGALGYVNKVRPGAELLEAVHKVARGEIALSPPMADRLMRRAVGAAPEPAGGVGSLTDRELEVFELIGRGLSTRAIADRLCLSVKTIETHREHMKTKLGVGSGAELNHLAAQWNAGRA
jgi:DNA-binding NarL/FixJ family response regulator